MSATSTLQQQRSALISEIAEQLNPAIERLVGRKDKASKKERLSLGAKKSNRVAKIHQLEADLAMEGEHVEPYADAPRSRHEVVPQAQIEASLAKAFAAMSSTPFEATKATLDSRISALLKAAEKNGYTVADPRKA